MKPLVGFSMGPAMHSTAPWRQENGDHPESSDEVAHV
jgi:hypothetical protein